MIVKFHFLFSVDCEWDRFGAWTECSTTCGEGFQRRRRTVKQRQRNGGKPCRGSETQSRNCNKGACSGKLQNNSFKHKIYEKDKEIPKVFEFLKMAISVFRL